jgi:hypothetical protein
MRSISLLAAACWGWKNARAERFGASLLANAVSRYMLSTG